VITKATDTGAVNKTAGTTDRAAVSSSKGAPTTDTATASTDSGKSGGPCGLPSNRSVA